MARSGVKGESSSGKLQVVLVHLLVSNGFGEHSLDQVHANSVFQVFLAYPGCREQFVQLAHVFLAAVSSEQDLHVDGLHQLEEVSLDFFASLQGYLLDRFKLYFVHFQLLAQLGHLFVEAHAVSHRLREVKPNVLPTFQERQSAEPVSELLKTKVDWQLVLENSLSNLTTVALLQYPEDSDRGANVLDENYLS